MPLTCAMPLHAAGGKAWMGAAYFGDRPTFNTNRTFLEVYLLDQDLDLYGRTLMVSLVDLVAATRRSSRSIRW